MSIGGGFVMGLLSFLGYVRKNKLEKAEEQIKDLENQLQLAHNSVQISNTKIDELTHEKQTKENNITSLSEEVDTLVKENQKIKNELEKAEGQINYLENQLLPEHNNIEVLNQKIQKLTTKQIDKENNIKSLSKEIDQLIREKQRINEEIIVLDDEVLYQSFNIFEPKYDFATSEEYKIRLNEIRDLQKEMVKNKTAVSYYNNWTVNGSRTEGRKMTNDNIKMILRCFNTDCDNAISKVKYITSIAPKPEFKNLLIH